MPPEPTSTYRVQLQPDFGFDQAAGIIPYLSGLGISHVYTSPYLQAAAGSTHGYDVVDPSRVNEELGGSEGHARFCEAIQATGLAHMIDVVPNHMAISGKQNPWWWDVLENGPSSRYATYFDVDWDASEERWRNKVLLPVLGDHYGRILEDGQIRLVREEGVFTLHYQDHVFPVDPSSLGQLLARAADRCGSEPLAFLAQSHIRLPRPTVTARQTVERRHRDKAVLANLLARLCDEDSEVNAAIDVEVDRLDKDADLLDSLIEQQNYRLAFWRIASRELGYRRFFDINDLAGLRVEDSEVFAATHALILRWVEEGLVQALRIDHPDGLREPTEYFRRLHSACPGAWIVAEKILEPRERIPSEWPIGGTTGYDFMNLVGGLFIDEESKMELARLYAGFTGEGAEYTDLVCTCKRQVLNELLGSELDRLTNLFVSICERHRRHRDYTRHQLREALRATAVFFPVYRSYVSAVQKHVREEDVEYVSRAIDRAAAERADLDPELFPLLKELLLLRVPGSLEAELAMRFQQLTGAAMAKGVEDTAFYRYHRLVALNEVGGDPNRFGVTLEEFHETCAEAQVKRPHALLATTTHDTKRSEDVRARLAVISEIPARWAETVSRWASHNERYLQGDFPDRNTEYLLYQTLVGAWPIDVERAASYMEKAVRESKAHTSWTKQDEAYEACLRDFIRAILQDREFREDLEGFVADLVLPGWINSLAQTLIKLTAPGVPDVYRGTELWDLSLVDPDNRRPVDFGSLRRLLNEIGHLSPETIMSRMDEGLPKLWITRQALHLRRARPEPFALGGSYRALWAEGSKAAHVVAFIRGESAVTVAPRLVMRLDGDWEDTALELPGGSWRNILTDDELGGGTVQVGPLLHRFPVALLVRED